MAGSRTGTGYLHTAAPTLMLLMPPPRAGLQTALLTVTGLQNVFFKTLIGEVILSYNVDILLTSKQDFGLIR